MKKQYSFKDNTRFNTSYNNSDKQMQYASNRFSKDAWTDMRIEEIKKKYETPSSYQRKTNVSYQGLEPRSRQPKIQTSYNRNFQSGAVNKDYSRQYLNRSDNDLNDDQNIPSFGIESKRDVGFYKKYEHRGATSQSPNYDLYSKKRNYTDYKNDGQKDFNPRQSGLYGKSNNQAQPSTYQKRSELKEINNYHESLTPKIDPRVQNIDRINDKIKKILDCLHDHDNYVQEHSKQEASTHKKKSVRSSLFAKEFQVVSGGQNSEELEETKILTRQKICGNQRFNDKDACSSQKKSIVQSPEPVFKIFGSRASESKRIWAQDLKKSIEGTEKFKDERQSYRKPVAPQQKSAGWFEDKATPINRSKSCLGGFKDGQDFQVRLSSGKKLDDQINKLNNRIKKFEEEKKKLEIDFKPYHAPEGGLRNNRSVSNFSTKSALINKPPLPKPRNSDLGQNPRKSELIFAKYSNRIKTENDQGDKSQKKYEMSKSSSNANLQRIMNKYKNKSQNQYDKELNSVRMSQSEKEQKEVASQKILFRNPSFQHDLNDPELSEKQKSEDKQEKASQKKFNKEIEDKAYQGIQNRKQKLLNIETATATFARETKRFIESLFEQAKIDEQLRNSKIWFRDFFFDNDKWIQLEKEVSKRNLKIQDMQHEFQISEEEDNPFYSVRQNPASNSLEALVNNWERADSFWKQNILHAYSLKQFQLEKFSLDKVDLERKGYFSVEDLVRFLNMQTGTFYRNRDLILIFRRFTKGNKLDWETFIETLNQNNVYEKIQEKRDEEDVPEKKSNDECEESFKDEEEKEENDILTD